MRIERRERLLDDHRTIEVHAVIIVESEDESRILDELQNPPADGDEEPILSAQVRLADGYGEHYILIRPIKSAKAAGAASGPPRRRAPDGSNDVF